MQSENAIPIAMVASCGCVMCCEFRCPLRQCACQDATYHTVTVSLSFRRALSTGCPRCDPVQPTGFPAVVRSRLSRAGEALGWRSHNSVRCTVSRHATARLHHDWATMWPAWPVVRPHEASWLAMPWPCTEAYQGISHLPAWPGLAGRAEHGLSRPATSQT